MSQSQQTPNPPSEGLLGIPVVYITGIVHKPDGRQRKHHGRVLSQWGMLVNEVPTGVEEQFPGLGLNSRAVDNVHPSTSMDGPSAIGNRPYFISCMASDVADAKLDSTEVRSSEAGEYVLPERLSSQMTIAIPESGSSATGYTLFGDLESGTSGFTDISPKKVHVGVDKDLVTLFDLGMVCSILTGWLTVDGRYLYGRPVAEPGHVLISTHAPEVLTLNTLQRQAAASSDMRMALIKTSTTGAKKVTSPEGLPNYPTQSEANPTVPPLILHQNIQAPYSVYPRRLWDLKTNRVIPTYLFGLPWSQEAGESADTMPARAPHPVCLPERDCKFVAISHSWRTEAELEYILTPINQCAWPVPIPKGLNIDDLRDEILRAFKFANVRYCWLDILCLRQAERPPQWVPPASTTAPEASQTKASWLEALFLQPDPDGSIRARELMIDVPTIGNVYQMADHVLRYFNGLGKEVCIDSGWDLPTHWLNRAWTLQEYIPDTVEGGWPLGNTRNHLNMEVFKDGKRQRIRELLAEIPLARGDNAGIIAFAAEVGRRHSSRPVDKVAAINYMLQLRSLPIYSPSESVEHAWGRTFLTLPGKFLYELLFHCPLVSVDSYPHWRPSWERLTTLPASFARYPRVPKGNWDSFEYTLYKLKEEPAFYEDQHLSLDKHQEICDAVMLPDSTTQSTLQYSWSWIPGTKLHCEVVVVNVQKIEFVGDTDYILTLVSDHGRTQGNQVDLRFFVSHTSVAIDVFRIQESQMSVILVSDANITSVRGFGELAWVLLIGSYHPDEGWCQANRYQYRECVFHKLGVLRTDQVIPDMFTRRSHIMRKTELYMTMEDLASDGAIRLKQTDYELF